MLWNNTYPHFSLFSITSFLEDLVLLHYSVHHHVHWPGSSLCYYRQHQLPRLCRHSPGPHQEVPGPAAALILLLLRHHRLGAVLPRPPPRRGDRSGACRVWQEMLPFEAPLRLVCCGHSHGLLLCPRNVHREVPRVRRSPWLLHH